MSRYIRVDAFIEACKQRNLTTAHQVYFELSRQPSIDICFCRECKYYYDGHWCSEWEYLKKNPDDFCSYGERRTDG